MVPEISGQEINDDNVNLLDTTSEPHVDMPESEDTDVSPLVVSSPPRVLRISQRIRKPVVKLNL